MSLKQELQTWSDALQAYEREDYDASLALFASIAESSRIHFNIGIIYATLGSLPVVTQSVRQRVEDAVKQAPTSKRLLPSQKLSRSTNTWQSPTFNQASLTFS